MGISLWENVVVLKRTEGNAMAIHWSSLVSVFCTLEDLFCSGVLFHFADQSISFTFQNLVHLLLQHIKMGTYLKLRSRMFSHHCTGKLLKNVLSYCHYMFEIILPIFIINLKNWMWHPNVRFWDHLGDFFYFSVSHGGHCLHQMIVSF